MKKAIITTLYILLLLTAFGLLIYQIFIQKDTTSLFKPILILVGILVSLVKFLFGGKRRKPSYKALKNSYTDLVGTAFSDNPAMEKKFYSAVQDFNTDKYSSALKKLDKLRAGADRGADRFAVEVFTALCCDELGLLQDAIRHYNAALQNKENSTAASNLGLCYTRAGNDRYAIEAYKRAVRADRNNPFPLNNLAQLYIRTGEYETAITYAEQAQALNSRMTQALSAMAVAHAMLGNQDEYLRYLRQAVANGYDGDKIRSYVNSLQISQ